MSNATNNEKITKLADDIYNMVLSENKKHPIVVLNRLMGYDYARLFKESEMNYTADCVMAEKLFLKEACKTKVVEVEKPSEEGLKIKEKIVKKVLSITDEMPDEERTKVMLAASKLQVKFEECETVREDVGILTYTPFHTDEESIVLEIGKTTKQLYESFCYQIALFAFNYFSTMRMFTYDSIDIEVFSICSVDSIDIICKLKG